MEDTAKQVGMMGLSEENRPTLQFGSVKRGNLANFREQGRIMTNLPR